jgi:proteasome accessory factor PafA2
MALPKVCGIETEYGIVVRGAENNPVSASSLLINAYIAATTRGRDGRVGWDFDDEHPTNDARGFSMEDAMAPDIETTLVNAVLTNGARYYVDHAHPEISTPEVATALEAVRFDRAAEEIIRRSMALATAKLATGGHGHRGADGTPEVVIYKNNSDGKGNSYGCHENYLLARETPFGRIVAQVTPHFVTRQVFCGAGKVGCELPGVPNDEVPYQLSQRADFFEEEVGLETTLKRPIVNTRDEPHCDAQKYRRLHVIVGDANMSEIATYLKVGTSAIVLAMIEDDALGDDWLLGSPVAAIRQVSHDTTLTRTIMLRDGRRATALEIQWGLLERARKYEQSHGLACVDEHVGRDILQRWEHVLTGLEHDPASVADRVDWLAKRRLVDGYAARHDVAPGAARLKAIDLQYHDMRADRCLARRAGLATLVDDDEVQRAMTEPPTSTRAYFRGRCLAKYPNAIVAANWDSMVFDIGREPLRRVPMMEPLRGTADHVARLIDESDSAVELLERLGS